MKKPDPQLRHIKDRSEIYFLWMIDYYDFPRSGICMYEYKPYYFCYEEEYNGEPDWNDVGWYQLYEISEKEFEDEKYVHDLFAAYVTDNSKFIDGTMKRKQTFVGTMIDEFYDNPDVKRIQKKHSDWHERKPVAWFE